MIAARDGRVARDGRADGTGRGVRFAWIGLVVCVLASLVIAAASPDPGSDVRRDYVDAPVGQPATGPDATAEVSSVRLARAVQKSYGDPFTSRQRLVVVNVSVAVRAEPRLLNQVSLQTSDENVYEPRDEFVSSGLGETQPGFTRRSTLVFEVPTEDVAGSRLVIDADSAAFDVYATALRIDLGLDDRTPVAAQPVSIPASTVAVTP